jgi:hypothetical protein
MARADARPQHRGADKSDWFGLRREMLLRMAAVEKMIPNLRASVAGAADSECTPASPPNRADAAGVPL